MTRRATYADLFDHEDGFDEEIFARLMDEPLPPPAAVPDVDRALAAAIAVRMDAAPAMKARGETTEAGTVRPGGVR